MLKACLFCGEPVTDSRNPEYNVCADCYFTRPVKEVVATLEPFIEIVGDMPRLMANLFPYKLIEKEWHDDLPRWRRAVQGLRS